MSAITFEGKPCRNGHGTTRYIKANKSCVVCANLSSKKQSQAARDKLYVIAVAKLKQSTVSPFSMPRLLSKDKEYCAMVYALTLIELKRLQHEFQLNSMTKLCKKFEEVNGVNWDKIRSRVSREGWYDELMSIVKAPAQAPITMASPWLVHRPGFEQNLARRL